MKIPHAESTVYLSELMLLSLILSNFSFQFYQDVISDPNDLYYQPRQKTHVGLGHQSVYTDVGKVAGFSKPLFFTL